MPKVSVIIPVYNKAKYVAEALTSVVNQTYKDMEIIVLDDGSTDNSKKVIQDFIKLHPEIVFIEEKENIGVCKARNKLISMAKGEYILPFDADDKLDETCVEKFADALDKNPEISVVYSNFRSFQKWNSFHTCNFDYDGIILENYLLCGSMYRKTDFYKTGGYKEWLNKLGCEDWELWISFAEKGFKFYKIDEALYYYRILGDEYSMSYIHKQNWKLIYSLIFEHHIETFKKSKKFMDIITDIDFRSYSKIKIRVKKYKKLFNLLLPISIAELLIIIALVSLIIHTFVSGGGI